MSGSAFGKPEKLVTQQCHHDHERPPLLFPAKPLSSKSATTVGKATSIRRPFLNFAFFIYLITRDVYKIDSSSRHLPELWITPIFSTGSRVYRMFDVLNKPCIRLARNAYRFRAMANGGRSAHSLLWIYMTLSTARLCEIGTCAVFADRAWQPRPATSRWGEQKRAWRRLASST